MWDEKRQGHSSSGDRNGKEPQHATTSTTRPANKACGRSIDGKRDMQHATSSAARKLEQAQQNIRKVKKPTVDDWAWEKAKQIESTVLPDAAPHKRARNDSPERVPCRLEAGTSDASYSVPPPPKRQLRQIQNNISESAFNTCDDSILRQQAPAPQLQFQDLETQQPLLTPAAPFSYGKHSSKQKIQKWLNYHSDSENEEDFVLFAAVEFASEAPAHLPDEIDDDLARFITQEDDNADRLVKELIPDGYLTFDWTINPDAFLGQREKFMGPSGPTFTLKKTDRPIHVFLKYFDNEILDLLVTEANQHCHDLARPFQQHSRLNRLKDTDRSEMCIFIAVLILQGLLPLRIEKDYFRENGYLTLKSFRSLMSYNRFIMLKRLLNFTDKEDMPTDRMTADDKALQKLGPFLNLLNRKFKALYLPSRDIAIDESSIEWDGHLSFAEIVATKAAKLGIKTYELCECNTGYCWSFVIYTGKGNTYKQTDRQDGQDRKVTDSQGDGQISAPTKATSQIVLNLIQPLLNRGHALVMDSFFNSPLLARYLKSQRTDCYGTLRVNREFFPDAIKSINQYRLRRGEFMQIYCHDLSVTVWRDSQLVALLSTMHPGKVGGKEKYDRYKIFKPQVVLDYNIAMGGVEKKDQILSSHPIERVRNQMWYKKVFRRLLNVTILNAYIVYKTRHPQTSQRQFRMALANDMITTFKTPQITRPLADNIVRVDNNVKIDNTVENTVNVVMVIEEGNRRRPILTGNHFVGQGHSRFLKCVWCKKSRTSYICKQCNVSLCLDSCFEDYHTKVKRR